MAFGGRDSLMSYMREVSLRETDVQRRLREETDRGFWAGWESSPEQAQFLALLVEAIAARRVLEVGTFTGVSALAMALALPDDGRLVTLDMVEETSAIARRYWKEAGVAGKIELRLAPAKDSLAALVAEGQAESFDMAFIDANKKDYDTYYEQSLVLCRAGGLIAIDNVFWGGSVLNARSLEKSTRAIRALNEKIHSDERVSMSMLPIRDGLTLAVKRA